MIHITKQHACILRDIEHASEQYYKDWLEDNHAHKTFYDYIYHEHFMAGTWRDSHSEDTARMYALAYAGWAIAKGIKTAF